MSSTASTVWKFFKKIDSKSVSCNLCGKTYKTSGNTTNLATHLKNKHQHAFVQLHKKSNNAKTKDGVSFNSAQPAVSTMSSSASCSSIPSTSTVDSFSDIEDGMNKSFSSADDFCNETLQTRNQQTLSDCLNRRSSLEEGGQRHSDITQALIYMICKDNLPLSSVEKAGLKRFSHVLCPHYKLPSRFKVTELMEQRYGTTKNILTNILIQAKHITLTSDILTVTNSTRSFIVVTANFLSDTEGGMESICLSAQRMFKAHTGEYIKEQFEEITNDFSIQKNQIVCMTTDGGSNMVAAVRLFLGENKRIPCMAHLINLIVDGVLKNIKTFSDLADCIKIVVTYFKQSVGAMDDLRAEQQACGKKEGEVLTLLQSVSTRWNSCFDMLNRFIQLSATVAKILALRSNTTKANVPDMLTTTQLNVVRDLIALLGPFKQVTEEISCETYVTASLAIPLSNLLRQEIEHATPTTEIGVSVQKYLCEGIKERLGPLEKNIFLAKATILDPRFKRLHFSSPISVASAISELSNDIRMDHRRRGQVSPELPRSENNAADVSSSLWARHEKMLVQAASSTPEVHSHNSVPNELKQYLDQPIAPKKSNPLKFWIDSHHYIPVLSDISMKYLIPSASSVASERIASTVNIVVPNNRSRLTGEHIKERVFLTSISDKYWFP